MTQWIPLWLVDPLTVVAFVAGAYLLSRFAVVPLTARLVDRRSPPLARPVSRIAHYIAIIVGVLTGLLMGGHGQVFGAMGAILAAGTFAVGFAMQDTIAAVVAGVFIFVDKPFQIGDWIEWDGTEGKVVDIKLRTTKVETFDNELITVPNDKITNTMVTNRTARNKLRMTTTFGIGYEDDIEEAKEIVRSILADIDGVASSPAPNVRLRELGESTVDLRAMYWIKNPKRAKIMPMREELLKRVKQEFEDADIDMPYPTQTIAGDSISLKE